MKLNESFVHYGDIDIDEFLNILEQLEEEDWERYTFRQDDHPYHAATKTIPLIYDEEFGTNRGKDSIYHNIFANCIRKVEEKLNAHIIRFVIVNLPAGEKIERHYDKAKDTFHIHKRVHLALITHPDVKFTVGDETIWMKPGELIEINNNGQLHGVENNSNVDRIHCIIDWHTKTKSVI
jgi:quercetin dioxygenase-like cupin family protein